MLPRGVSFYQRTITSGQYELVSERIVAGHLIKTFYSERYGKLFRRFLTGGGFNVLTRWYYNSSLSKKNISAFIKKFASTPHPILVDEIKKDLKDFKTFNDFFIREIKPESHPVDSDSDTIVSPADSKVLVVENVQKETSFFVKNSIINLEKLLKNKVLAESYYGGTIMVFRLAPYDYHRFHVPYDCDMSQVISIKGRYESVNPTAYLNGVMPFLRNKRHFRILKTNNCDDVVMMAVGAMAVGKIVWNDMRAVHYKKGEQAGRFEYGGSTVILLFKKDTIVVDETLLNHSQQKRPDGGIGYETAIRVGQRVAVVNN